MSDFDSITIDTFVYEWTDNTNGMKYIGLHKGCPLDGYIGSGTRFKKAYSQRPELFVRRIIAMGSLECMREYETNLLRKLKARTNPAYYNLSENNICHTGGKSLLKGKPSPKKGMPSPLKGRPRSEATKIKISVAAKGRPNPKGSEALKGRTNEALAQRNRLRAGLPSKRKGIPLTIDHRNKLSAAKAGKTRGPSPMKGMTRDEYRRMKEGNIL
jgi:hypothetical protein